MFLSVCVFVLLTKSLLTKCADYDDEYPDYGSNKTQRPDVVYLGQTSTRAAKFFDYPEGKASIVDGSDLVEPTELSLPYPKFEMLKPNGFRLTLLDVPANVNGAEYECVCFKDATEGRSNVTSEWNTEGQYAQKGDRWFYENTDLKFDNGDMFFARTGFNYSDISNPTYAHMPRWDYRCFTADIHVPRNGSGPYFNIVLRDDIPGE